MMETPSGAQMEMPRYKSHKQVWALKIKAVELHAASGHIIHPEDQRYAPFKVADEYIQKHNPQPGGYYVVYDDGYKSFSPAKAFEEGYTAEDKQAAQVSILETAIKAFGADRAPRVTPADIEAEIASEHYCTADDGVSSAAIKKAMLDAAIQGTGVLYDAPLPSALGMLTFCVLVLRNGYTVTGESACASPENFNAEIGRRIARENAVAKIWPLLGFRLRDKLAAVPLDFRDRVREEKRALDENLQRLSAFLVTEKFEALNFAEQADLHAQKVAMTTYSEVLGRRIAAFEQGQSA